MPYLVGVAERPEVLAAAGGPPPQGEPPDVRVGVPPETPRSVGPQLDVVDLKKER